MVAAPENPPAQKTLLKGQQPLAGATAANLSPALADELQLDSDWQGVVIVEIRRGTTAYRFGFAPGDIITSINGQPVNSATSLTAILDQHHPGDNVTVGAGSRTANVTLGDGPPG